MGCFEMGQPRATQERIYVPSIIGRAIRLAQSPQGKKLIAEAQKAARDPKNKQRIEQVRQRFTKR